MQRPHSLLGPCPHVDSTPDSVGRLPVLVLDLMEVSRSQVVAGSLAGVGGINQPTMNPKAHPTVTHSNSYSMLVALV